MHPPRPGSYYCPEGHAHTCADAFKRRGYTKVDEDTQETTFGASADACRAAVCWLPGWPEQRFKSWDRKMYRDYDTVNVVVSGSGTFELWINPLAVTNLRTNIEDRNLWDKALLIKAIGQRQWLPLTVVRDVDQHAGLFGILPELGGEDESEEEEDYSKWKPNPNPLSDLTSAFPTCSCQKCVPVFCLHTTFLL